MKKNNQSRARAPKVSEEKMVKAIENSFGIKTLIAQRLRINRLTVTKYLEKMPDAKIAYEQEHEAAIDFAENELLKAVKAGEFMAVQFFLKTQGKKRGYNEKYEINHSGEIKTPDLKIIIESE